MRIKLAGLLTLLMVLCMGTTVFANESPDIDKVNQDMVETARDKVNVVADNIAFNATTVSPTDCSEATNTATTEVSKDAKLMAAVELTTSDNVSKGVNVKFTISGVHKGDNILVLHKKKDGKWEKIAPVVGEGYIIVNVDSLSPFAVYLLPAGTTYSADRTTPANATVGATSSTTTPATTSTTNNYYTTTTTPTPSVTYVTNNYYNNTNSNNTSNVTNSNNTTTNEKATATTKSATTKKTSDKKVTTKKTAKKTTAKDTKDNAVTVKNTQTVTVKVSGTPTAGSTVTTSVKNGSAKTSPKTGASMPALPMIAMFAVMGIAYCGKKAYSL